MIKQCTVVVYGDLGRSPRMQNHVKELLELNYQVNYLGYLGTSSSTQIRQSSATIDRSEP
jgi:hypothetical protein